MTTNRKDRVAILGATGYGGGELLRLCLQDPKVEVVFATSRNRAGVPVEKVHRNLTGVSNLAFTDPTHEQLAVECDFIFGALPHGASAEVLGPLVDAGKRVIDLSGDFRLKDMDEYRKWYGREHPRPDLIASAVYGCPEVNRQAIAKARLVASPGCFATAINLALLPAASEGMLTGRPSVVALTGSSGAGATVRETTHHPVRAESARAYKVLEHQHVPECVQTLREAGSPALDGLDFTPVSIPIIRGIIAIATAKLRDPVTELQLRDLYELYYNKEYFVKTVLDREPECQSIAGTNFAEVRPRRTPAGELHAICTLDNLVKGGAGQGYQCYRLMSPNQPDETAPPLGWLGTWP